MKSKTTLFSLLTLSLILSVFWLSARAQQPAAPPETQMLNQILTEVRQLRTAMQHASQSVYRGQFLLEQLRTHQEKVARLSGQLEELRTQQTQLRAQQPQMQERLRQLETEINNEQNAPRRTQLEAEAKGMRQYFDTMNAEEPTLQQREQQLVQQLLAAQTAVQDLATQFKAVEIILASIADSPTTVREQHPR